MRVCVECGAELPTQHPRRRYCSERCRKAKYGGTCERCGAPNDGRRSGEARRLCAACAHRPSFDREAAIAAVRAWVAEHGEPPTSIDWKHSGGQRHPDSRRMRKLFGSWTKGLLAAGVEPKQRMRAREDPRAFERTVELYEAGVPIVEIARVEGITPNGVRVRLRRRGVELRPSNGTPRYEEWERTLARRLAADGMTNTAIAEVVGCHRLTVGRWLREARVAGEVAGRHTSEQASEEAT